jgi:hypothetical protein
MKLVPSLRFAMLLLSLHAITAIAACLIDMPVAAILVILALVASSLFFYLARDVFGMFAGSWTRFSMAGGEVSVVTRAGVTIHGKVAQSTVVFAHLIVLRIIPEGGFRTVSRVIFPDALGRAEFRDLCVRLRFN